jgi:hypothetical protein
LFVGEDADSKSREGKRVCSIDRVGVCPMESPEPLQRQRWPALPRKGDRIELLLPRLGTPVRGRVFYVDDLQILVKWDDGRSESLRSDFADRFRIVEPEA